jgi:hypothetical protein
VLPCRKRVFSICCSGFNSFDEDISNARSVHGRQTGRGLHDVQMLADCRALQWDVYINSEWPILVDWCILASRGAA